ncbi:hypothetical protein RFI_08608 [Reticulomyxa filosa]|uniref:Uncharacterized protein n=1 Tax=Reticulomyxa filosa TaxID=46433 RepID=X6NT88_RETFI|nr:hypothetical protein RFI_08608 [Reticulomyxa filosa]|eukprot:ETO28522.1 hypothetical protein RFI_08608 [Reticulomyxa filosa]
MLRFNNCLVKGNVSTYFDDKVKVGFKEIYKLKLFFSIIHSKKFICCKNFLSVVFILKVRWYYEISALALIFEIWFFFFCSCANLYVFLFLIFFQLKRNLRFESFNKRKKKEYKNPFSESSKESVKEDASCFVFKKILDKIIDEKNVIIRKKKENFYCENN